MPAYLLDTGILTRHLRRRVGYPELIRHLNQSGDLYISAFTRLEIMRGDARTRTGTDVALA